MKSLPTTNDALLLRTDFSHDAAWEDLRRRIKEPVGGFLAYVECVSDPAFDGLTLDQLVALSPPDTRRTFFLVADERTLTHNERPIVVIDLTEHSGRSFRVIPSELWGVENNLSLANMDFGDFADSVDADGVFRGFPP